MYLHTEIFEGILGRVFDGSRRVTVAVLLTISRNLSAALLERASCTNRNIVEMTTIVEITMLPITSSV